MAVSSLDLAMSAIGDSKPPLCVLQALILATHWLLIQGVHGRAWRYLGLCIRLAYELRLHSLDAGRASDYFQSLGAQWCEDEEKRRAWWAIRELDIFASAHRRLPLATLDATHDVFLPADTEKWFAGEPQRGCYLLPGFITRSKALVNAGNNSPLAWHMVINSFLAEAYDMSSLNMSAWDHRKGSSDHQSPLDDDSTENSRLSQEERLKALLASLYFFKMALPPNLKYTGQYLSFGADQYSREDTLQTAKLHCWVLSISMLVDLATMLTLKPFVLGAGTQILTHMLHNVSGGENAEHRQYQQRKAYTVAAPNELGMHLERYFAASDSIFGIITNCHETYKHYVNPFLAQAPGWLLLSNSSARP